MDSQHSFSFNLLLISLWCQLETSEEFEKISTADERKSFIEKLDEVSLFPGFSKCFWELKIVMWEHVVLF